MTIRAEDCSHVMWGSVFALCMQHRANTLTHNEHWSQHLCLNLSQVAGETTYTGDGRSHYRAKELITIQPRDLWVKLGWYKSP